MKGSKKDQKLDIVPFVNDNYNKARRERDAREVRAGNRKAFIYGFVGIIGFLIMVGGLGTIELKTIAEGLPTVICGGLVITLAVALTELTI